MAINSLRQDPGNYISEWFGQRIFPQVRIRPDFPEQQLGRCPFLSKALNSTQDCVKPENSAGVCTVNAAGARQAVDWLACPYRVISSGLLADACRRIFEADTSAEPVPATVLESPAGLRHFKRQVRAEGQAYIVFQAKLGGEISIPATQRSPEISFDATIFEVRRDGRSCRLGRCGIVEIQTMDFHGSYRKDFPGALQRNLAWASEGIEGPNIANVFKRTFYQTMIKFQLAARDQIAGTVLALPRSVWDSWQPFLGGPTLESVAPGVARIAAGQGIGRAPTGRAQITIFELNAASKSPVSPVKICEHILVDAEQLAHHALQLVPRAIVESLREVDSMVNRVRRRLAHVWPDLA